jgi:hypothetical protein
MAVKRTDDLRLLIEIFYTMDELSTEDIKKIFPGCSLSFLNKKKLEARKQMAEENSMAWSNHCVKTTSAFNAWGINIEEIETKALKLKALQKKLT